MSRDGTGLAEGTFAVGTFDTAGARLVGLVLPDGGVIDVTSRFPSTREALARWGSAFQELERCAAEQRPTHELAALRPLPPVDARQILQAGANYHKHVFDLILAEHRAAGRTEQSARAEARRIMDARVAHGEPYVFLGASSAMCGAYDDVVLPRHGQQHDWELELAAVIGPGATVAAYTIVNDITTRDLVYRPDLKAIGTDWLRAKNAPTFLPTGPFIVPAAFVDDPQALTITLRHNGDVMQNESTADMIFDVERLRSYTADHLRLLPGDLLLTGSPAGNGSHWGRFLAGGDVMESEITGLGRQRNRCTAA